MSDYEELREQFELMWNGLAEMPWAVSKLSEYLDDGGDLAAIPDLDRLARGILLPHTFETATARLALINEIWDEYEKDNSEVKVETTDPALLASQRRLLWASEGLLHDDLARRFSSALPPSVRAHIDQLIAQYRAELAQIPNGGAR